MGNSTVMKSEGHAYCNPKPHLRSIVAYHPSLVAVEGSELIATFGLRQAGEVLDYHTVLARSVDAGNTYELAGP